MKKKKSNKQWVLFNNMSDLGDEGEQKLDLPLVANEENIKNNSAERARSRE